MTATNQVKHTKYKHSKFVVILLAVNAIATHNQKFYWKLQIEFRESARQKDREEAGCGFQLG